MGGARAISLRDRMRAIPINDLARGEMMGIALHPIASAIECNAPPILRAIRYFGISAQ
jgi:hypothetical protein